MNRCGACQKEFRSVPAFDMHRIGEHGKDRRCMTDLEMLESGMALSNGVWVTSKMPELRLAALRALRDREK